MIQQTSPWETRIGDVDWVPEKGNDKEHRRNGAVPDA